ncbi:hypothetical protein [Sulfurimonas sp. HSL-1716]|uniref:hypothetical protein n=1 Tax=Hydrocurvibacter sulfurireducens TaxID=3131937 RepID=UPI0031F867A5
MIKYILLSCTLVLLAGCSFATPKNDWQINSINAYESYKRYYLKNEDNLADTDLKRAVKYAKQSADLDTLARIYLSECALHTGVLKKDSCEKYKDLDSLVVSDELHGYYLFLQNRITKEEIKNLPSRYRDFAAFKENGDYKDAQKEVQKMDDIVSKMIAASLIKDALSADTVKKIIEEASFYGYKKAVVSWMKFYKTKITDDNEKGLIMKRLKILSD